MDGKALLGLAVYVCRLPLAVFFTKTTWPRNASGVVARSAGPLAGGLYRLGVVVGVVSPAGLRV